MQLILLRDVPGVGKKGQLVTVNDGYGNNFLIRKGLASHATRETKEKVIRESKETEARKFREQEQSKQRKADIEKRAFTIPVTVGGQGKMFGAVREKDIADAIAQKMGIVVEKNDIAIEAPIKTLGGFTAQLRLAGGATARVTINVVEK